MAQKVHNKTFFVNNLRAIIGNSTFDFSTLYQVMSQIKRQPSIRKELMRVETTRCHVHMSQYECWCTLMCHGKTFTRSAQEKREIKIHHISYISISSTGDINPIDLKRFQVPWHAPLSQRRMIIPATLSRLQNHMHRGVFPFHGLQRYGFPRFFVSKSGWGSGEFMTPD